MFKFVDIFAGIGGIRLGFDSIGGDCVFSSEIDTHARETYQSNFNEVPHGDIKKISAEEVPKHDLLLAGFPCPTFSIAGVSKLSSMGREHGLLDDTRGTLFFEICRILEYHNPRVFLLENVKGLLWNYTPLEKLGGLGPKKIEALMNHFKKSKQSKENNEKAMRKTIRYASEKELCKVTGIGKFLAKRIHESRTIVKMTRTLEELGYTVKSKVINSENFVPQRRERIFIVGFNNGTKFEFPELPDDLPMLKNILEEQVDSKYTINDHLWAYHQDRKKKQKEKGNGFGFKIFNGNQSSGTLSARYYKDGADLLIEQMGQNPRKLTPRECARLMGFPDDFKLNKSENQSYKQLGNAVVASLVSHLAKAIKEQAKWI